MVSTWSRWRINNDTFPKSYPEIIGPKLSAEISFYSGIDAWLCGCRTSIGFFNVALEG
jgi:hypothetical protein